MYFEYVDEKQEVTRSPWSRTACWGPSLGAGSVVGGEGRKWRSGAEGVREWQGGGGGAAVGPPPVSAATRPAPRAPTGSAWPCSHLPPR